jgi:hypothetical protein
LFATNGSTDAKPNTRHEVTAARARRPSGRTAQKDECAVNRTCVSTVTQDADNRVNAPIIDVFRCWPSLPSASIEGARNLTKNDRDKSK